MSEATAADQLADQVFALRAQVTALREALTKSREFIRPRFVKRELMAEIDAALEMSGGVK